MLTPKRLLSAAALAATALAIPTAAHADPWQSQSLGSSLGAAPTNVLTCKTGCTFVMDTIGTQIYADLGYKTDPLLVTRFRAKLAAGTTATLRSFERGGYNSFTPRHTGETVTGTGQLETYESHMRIGHNETIGLDLKGSVAGVADTGVIHILDYRQPDDTSSQEQTPGEDLEPMLNATVETDTDEDGLGDNSQDPCWYSCDSSDSGSDAGSGSGGGSSYGGSSSSGGSSSGSSSSGGSGSVAGDSSSGTAKQTGNPRSNENIRSRRTLTIQDIGLVTRGRKPVATAYLYNPRNDSVTGTATLKVGGKVVAKARAYASTLDAIDFTVTKKVAKKLAKGTKGTVTANVASDEDGKQSDSYAVAFKGGVTTAYDGTYRAKGPIVIKVQDGVVRTATASLFASSTNGSGSQTRAFFLPDGVPAVIGRDGKVEVHGHAAGSDEMRFKAEFRKNGTIKGYISLWHYELGMSSGGRIQSTPYLGASNWIAKKQ